MAFTRDRDRPFHKAFTPLAQKVQDDLTRYLGDYEFAEDDAWFIVSGFRKFAHWGGTGFTEPYKPEETSIPNRQTKRDFLAAASALQKAYETALKLRTDAGAADAIDMALFDNCAPNKEKLPIELFQEALSGIDKLGKAIQKVHDDGVLFKSYWRKKDQMKRAIIRDLASIFVARYRKDPNNDSKSKKVFGDLLSHLFGSLEINCPNEKTITNELTIKGPPSLSLL